MNWPQHMELAEKLLPAVLEAGRVEMGYYAGPIDVEHKADSSPVTAADKEAEAILLEALARAAPGIPVIAEESASAGQLPETGEVFFLVDPLDGTKEFIAKRGEFTVNVALVVNGRPQFGIVYAPASSDLFMTVGPQKAVEGRFAPDCSLTGLQTSGLRTLKVRSPGAGGLVAIESRSHGCKAVPPFMQRLKIKETKRAGSSLKFCLIARGEADIYARLGETCEWDTAAGHAILAAAGGRVVTLDGKDLVYGKRERKFVNPHFVALGANQLISFE